MAIAEPETTPGIGDVLSPSLAVPLFASPRLVSLKENWTGHWFREGVLVYPSEWMWRDTCVLSAVV